MLFRFSIVPLFALWLVLMFLPFIINADQRFETVGGFCHFVTPEGFQTANDDNEVFFANCLNSIRQKANGDGEGSTLVTVEYPVGALPFKETYTTTGARTGINCTMVDSNGTQYTTQDWTSTYTVKLKVDRHREMRPSQRPPSTQSITYMIRCRNAAQQ